MDNALIVLPLCPSNEEHGQLELRPEGKQTPEQRYCGAWYDCKHPGCHCSVLFPSPELREVYKKAGKVI